ncbi:hypothetical protein, partial [Rhodomicrobium udaipurense]|uniref:hypothetical protein n=1 Tax=Rhodomicrobium udaipurense TaxID=1202716 RepID=UPI001AEC4E92
ETPRHVIGATHLYGESQSLIETFVDGVRQCLGLCFLGHIRYSGGVKPGCKPRLPSFHGAAIPPAFSSAYRFNSAH